MISAVSRGVRWALLLGGFALINVNATVDANLESPTAESGDECDFALELPLMTSGAFIRNRHNAPNPESVTYIESFVREGLPELHRVASENDLTIGELLTDLHATLHLYFEIRETLRPVSLDVQMRNLKQDCDNIERLIGRTKLKRNHHMRTRNVMTMLRTVAAVLANAELDRTGSTRINPYSPMNRAFILNLLDASEDGQLELALNRIVERKARSEKFRRETEERRQIQLAARATVAPTPDVLEPTAEPAPAPELDEEIEPPYDDQANLAAILKDELPLRADWAYDARTSQGTQLRVFLTPGLLKQEDGGQRLAVRRLLKGVLVGRGHAGVKLLTGLGEKIVEVKAILHGHKRILGCLDGRTLRLLRMIDIKADGSTYARRIPKDLCE